MAAQSAVELTEDILDSDKRTDKLVLAYKEARLQAESWENQTKEARAKVEEAIGTNKGLRGLWGHITWAFNKPSLKVDWQTIAEGLLLDLPEAKRDKLVAKHTTEVPGPRVFRVTWAKEFVGARKVGAK
jgi:hypothetical protein